MAVYMIQAGDDGPVKIGSAKNPESRLSEFQTGHHVHLRIIRLFEGGLKEEMGLHKKFARARIRSEWFDPDPDILSGDTGLIEIRLDPSLLRRRRINPNDTKLKQAADRNGLSGIEIARQMGVTPATASRWLSRKQAIPDI